MSASAESGEAVRNAKGTQLSLLQAPRGFSVEPPSYAGYEAKQSTILIGTQSPCYTNFDLLFSGHAMCVKSFHFFICAAVDAYEGSIKVTGGNFSTYTPELADEKSPEYQEMANKVISAVRNASREPNVKGREWVLESLLSVQILAPDTSAMISPIAEPISVS